MRDPRDWQGISVHVRKEFRSTGLRRVAGDDWLPMLDEPWDQVLRKSWVIR